MDSDTDASSSDPSNCGDECILCREVFEMSEIQLLLLRMLEECELCIASTGILYCLDNHVCNKFCDLVENALCKDCFFFLFGMTEKEAYDKIINKCSKSPKSASPENCHQEGDSSKCAVNNNKSLENSDANQNTDSGHVSVVEGKSPSQTGLAKSEDTANINHWYCLNDVDMATSCATRTPKSKIQVTC